MLLFDAHLNLAYNAIEWNRNLELSVEEIRASDAPMTELGRGTGTVSLPEMRRGEEIGDTANTVRHAICAKQLA